MKSYNNKRGIAYTTTVFQIFLYCTLALSTTVHSQTVDTQAPILGIDSVSESFQGESQVFTVTATDDGEVAELTIYYRLGDAGVYANSVMTRIGSTDLFTFTIPAQEINSSVELVQYYIDARDTAGNRTLQGFSFDPLERTLLLKPALAESSVPTTENSSSLLGSLSTTQKVAYGAVALVVVGVLVASASDGDSDSGLSADEPGGQSTPVTIVTAPLVPVQ